MQYYKKSQFRYGKGNEVVRSCSCLIDFSV